MTEPSSPTTGDQDVALVPGEVRAYRLWRYQHPRVLPGRREITGRLTSTGWNVDLDPLVQTNGLPYTAVCQRLNRDASYRHEDGDRSPVPAEKCTCGFYGTYIGGLSYAFNAARRNLAAHAGRSEVVLGSVLMSGRVIFGSTGVLRAERMRLEGVLSLPAKWDTHARADLDTIRAQYGIPGFWDPAAFVEQYPQADLTHLATEAPTEHEVAGFRGIELVQIFQHMAEVDWASVDIGRCKCVNCTSVSRELRLRELALRIEDHAVTWTDVMNSLTLALTPKVHPRNLYDLHKGKWVG